MPGSNQGTSIGLVAPNDVTRCVYSCPQTTGRHIVVVSAGDTWGCVNNLSSQHRHQLLSYHRCFLSMLLCFVVVIIITTIFVHHLPVVPSRPTLPLVLVIVIIIFVIAILSPHSSHSQSTPLLSYHHRKINPDHLQQHQHCPTLVLSDVRSMRSLPL